MRRVAVALPLFLSGCFLFTGGAASVSDTKIPDRLKGYTPFVPSLADLHPYAAPGAPASAWARYRVRRDGAETVVTLGVAGVEGDDAWIEVVIEGDLRTASLRRLGPDRRITRALFREVGPQGVSEVLPQELTPAEEEDPLEPDDQTAAERTVPVGDRQLAATVVKSVYRDEALGKSLHAEAVWSPAIPALYATSPYGGLVRLDSQLSGLSIEILDWGTDYRPVIPLPR